MDFGSLLFSFRGRIGRAEFWIATLIMIVAMVLAIVVLMTSMESAIHVGLSRSQAVRSLTGFGLLLILFVLGLFVMNLAVQVKRMHDLGLSGWLIVPVTAAAIVLAISGLSGLSSILNLAFVAYLGFAPGQHGPNRFGSPAGGGNLVGNGAPSGTPPSPTFAAPVADASPTARAAWESSADSAIAAALQRHNSQSPASETQPKQRRNLAAASGFGRRRPA